MRYPTVLLGAAFNDAHVPAWQPGKLDAGHGTTSKSRLDLWFADQLALLCSQPGHPGHEPPRAATSR